MKCSYRIGFLLFFASCINLFSQSKTTKTVIDSATKQPIDYVYINSDDNKIKTLSNVDGKFILSKDSKTKYFTFYKIGYYPKTILTDAFAISDSIFMTARAYKLPEISITAQTLETIVKDKRYYVDDYVILPNGDFLLITSRFKENECEIAYFQKDKGITCKRKIENELQPAFFTDCFKNIQFITSKYSRQVFFDSDTSFGFLSKYSRIKFDSTLAKCVLKVDSQIIVKSSLPPRLIKGVYFDTKMNSPFLTYLRVGKKNRQHFYTAVYNKHMREMMDNEINDSQSIKASLDAAGVHRSSDQAYESSNALFFEKVAKPIYAPIFLKDDTVLIFNFQENIILFMSKTGILFKEVKIKDSDFSTYRDFEIIYDAIGQMFYFKTKETDRSTLSLMDIYSGKLIKKIRLEKIFSHHIQVYDGKIYYLVREKDWDDTAYLYQQNQ